MKWTCSCLLQRSNSPDIIEENRRLLAKQKRLKAIEEARQASFRALEEYLNSIDEANQAKLQEEKQPQEQVEQQAEELAAVNEEEEGKDQIRVQALDERNRYVDFVKIVEKKVMLAEKKRIMSESKRLIV